MMMTFLPEVPTVLKHLLIFLSVFWICFGLIHLIGHQDETISKMDPVGRIGMETVYSFLLATFLFTMGSYL